jgi:hypothetical protein
MHSTVRRWTQHLGRQMLLDLAATMVALICIADGCDVINLSLGGMVASLVDTYSMAIMHAAGTCAITEARVSCW